MLAALRRLAIVTVLVTAAVASFATPAHAITSTSTTPEDGSTVQPPASVSAEHDASLDTVASTITVANKNANLVAGTVTFTTTLILNDTIVFTPTSTLSELGSPYAVSVHAEDLVGSETVDTSFSFAVDTTPPAAPTITSVEDPVNAANQTTVTVVGGADELTTVTVSIDDQGNPETDAVSTSVAVDDGFTADVDVSTLDDGTLDVTVEATDEAGNISPPVEDQTTKDSTVPAVPVVTIIDDPITSGNQAEVDITGTSGEANLTIDVSVDDQNAGTEPITASTSTAVDGTWSVVVDLSSLSEGTITARATATDAVGNKSTAGTDTATKELGAPQVVSTSPGDGSTVQSPAEITASFNEPLDIVDSEVTVVDSTLLNIQGTTSFRDSNTTIVFTPTGALSSGGSPYTVTLAVEDVANNAEVPPTDFTFTITDDEFFSFPQTVNGTYTPIPGDFDGDGAADIFWYAPGGAPDSIWLSDGDGDGTFTSAPQTVNGTYTPIPGDHNNDGRTDIFWYAPGSAPDWLWLSDGDGTFTTINRTVTGTYTPIPGDYNDDGRSDIFWYAPGGAPDSIWLSNGDGTFTTRAHAVTGTYTPILGDFDGDGAADIFWYAPGGAPDHLWLSNSNGTFTSTPQTVNGTYTPIPGDYDGDGRTDIFWYGPGSVPDNLWVSDGDGTFTSEPQTVSGTFTPIPGDYDGDGAADILWYAPGSGSDPLWLSNGDGTFTTRAQTVNGTYRPIPADYDGDGRTDIFWYAPGPAPDSLWIAVPS